MGRESIAEPASGSAGSPRIPPSDPLMPLSRSNRIDRRRRVMLDAVAADSEYAVETARAKRRIMARERSDEEEGDVAYKARDPGYSQAVRKACQQRMVQLIPVRRGTLAIVLTCMWLLWGTLLFSHYWIHVRMATIPLGKQISTNASQNISAVSNLADQNKPALPPIAFLFDLRSSHSIAHWLTCQLWMLTALSAWMIFQLRRHRMDDYRARYRIWVVLAIVAAFSSFDASSSGLYLLGLSIDGWARKEIGYGGWPLVLASFASLVGVMGIRLCSELKTAPMSVVSWLLGLSAWAVSALLGTGLLKTTWPPATTDMIVGSCWFGGILAVFQASGIYLRQTYIHAQKRFLERNGANLAPIQWKMPRMKIPKISLRRNGPAEHSDAREGLNDEQRRPWKLKLPTWPRGREQEMEGQEDDGDAKSKTNRNRNRADEPFHPKDKPAGRLFGVIQQRQELNEKLVDDPIREDDGPTEDQGLTKKRGWFGIGGNRHIEPVMEKTERKTDTKAAKLAPDQAKQSDALAKKAAPKQDRVNHVSKDGNGVKKSWLSSLSRKTKSSETPAAKKPEVAKERSDDGNAKPGRRGLFGMLDGFKLKPPLDASSGPRSAVNQGPAPTKPIPIRPGQSLPSTQSDAIDDEEDEDNSGRAMSKAERRKMRRQQDDRRAA